MKNKFFKSIILVTIISVFLAACNDDSNVEQQTSGEAGNEGESAQEISFATSSDAVGLSPIDTNDSVSAYMLEQLYDTLFIHNPETMEIEPHLVESYEAVDDTTWEFKLLEGVEFHDGTPLNAEAVKYTFEQLLDEERAAPRASLLEPVESIEAVDEYTVVINTEEPYGPLLAALSHVNASIVSPEADEAGDIMTEPVGSGPFKFESWASGDNIVLTKNENYFKGAPSLDTVTMHVIPEYASAVGMLETGQVDFLPNIPSEHIPRIEEMDGVELDLTSGTGINYLTFNMEKAPFNDLEFRKAVSHAIDRDEYVEQLNGAGIQNNSIIGPEVFGYDEAAQEFGYDYDLEEAQRIIEENNFDETPITLLVANEGHFVLMSEIVQAQLMEAGFDVSIEMMEWGAFLEQAANGNFEMAFVSWANSTADGSELFYPNLHSDNIGSTNRARYNNEEFDELVEQSRTTIDQEERLELLHETNEYATNDAVWIPMHHANVSVAYHESVNDLIISPNTSFFLYEVSIEE
ncbi:ABC transporter substrate-binding protein [Salinicoccus halitifaciens]|uniref:Peptide/nickel transport system substrate-binding protein n=1 Tax=Salinicoccus halitifaciens TaxID=1073415 RepID=A0ABV2E868_9STAP|nr:ABC transporter substrate-binding protein [Salinicoccus halitifaciens]MCD2137752.1 ABC transporter substrate-binding protein [Salinicoccus halitifaciens]